MTQESTSASTDKIRVTLSAVSTTGLTAIYTVLLLVTTILLARWLGPHEYGVYALVTAVTVILGHLATPGTENVLVRDVASYGVSEEHGASRGLMGFANRVALGVSASLVVLVPLVTWVSHSFRFGPATTAMLIGCLIIPISALSRVRAATLMGLHSVLRARVPELVVRPIVLLILVSAAWWWGSAGTAVTALVVTLLAYAASYVVGVVLLRRAMPRGMREDSPVHDYPRWLRSMPPFLAMGFSDVLASQLSITLIGWLGTARDAGVFAVANRGAAVVALGFAGVAAVAAPRIAHLWARQDLAGLDALLRHCTLLSGALAGAALLVIVGFHSQLLSIFGQGFTTGGRALIVLAVGQFAYATIGVRATALLMTGGERQAAFVLLLSMVLTTALSAALIPTSGGDGAAIAWTSSMLVGQVLTVLLWRRHRRVAAGVLPTPSERAAGGQPCAG